MCTSPVAHQMSSSMSSGRRLPRRQAIPVLYTRGTHYEVGFDMVSQFRVNLLPSFLSSLVFSPPLPSPWPAPTCGEVTFLCHASLILSPTHTHIHTQMQIEVLVSTHVAHSHFTFPTWIFISNFDFLVKDEGQRLITIYRLQYCVVWRVQRKGLNVCEGWSVTGVTQYVIGNFTLITIIKSLHTLLRHLD